MAENSPPPARRFQPMLVEESVKKVRRFAPEPVETTTRSSKKAKEEPTVAATETKDFVVKKRFSPIPIETSVRSSKKQAGNPLPTPETTPTSIPKKTPQAETPKPRRRFTPELIETSKRSKKSGVSGPATLPTDKTDLTPGVPNIYTRPKRNTDVSLAGSTADLSLSSYIALQTPRRQGSMRPHLNTRSSTRQNSYQPDLESIRSESSDDDKEEEPPSLTYSLESEEEEMMQRKQLARTRESCDDRFSGYLLALAAKAAEKQLREQALLSAFPNESAHEIVEHFYDREIDGTSDEESVEGIGMLLQDPIRPEELRRKSTEVGWAFKEMQEHQEKLNRQREEETNKKIAAEARSPTFKDPFWTNGQNDKSSPFSTMPRPVDRLKEAELRSMRLAASPPMLGGDLKFRMCPSPKATKFESDQHVDIQPNRSDTGGGLWGGYCVAEEAGEYLSPAFKGPEMIQTPNVEREDPFSFAFSSEVPVGSKSPTGAKTPRNRDSGVRMLAGIEERLKSEIEKSKMEELFLQEFDDTFITQVYNYLSLGYPALARQYDEELSKITNVSQDDLRKDDNSNNAKGYIGITDPTNGKTSKPDDGDKHANYCTRWKALRTYVLVWAKQHPSMSNGAAQPDWGVRARRGSWAI